MNAPLKAKPKKAEFAWHDPLLLEAQLTEQERIVPGEFGLLGLGFERGVHGNSPVGPQASRVSNDTPSRARRFSHGLAR